MKLRIHAVRDEAKDIRAFELRSLGPDDLPPFTAGAHLRLALTLPSGQVVERCYSIASDPQDRRQYEIAVRLDPHGGGGSRHLHEQVAEGDILTGAPPRNDFPLVEGAERSILIAGGIGITPIVAMLHTLAARHAPVEVHYAAAEPARLAYRDTVRRLAGPGARFYYGGPTSPSRMNIRSVLGTPSPGTHVYVCGPYRMIEAVRESAAASGWLPHQIHLETFLAGPQPNDSPVTVALARSGMTVEVGADTTILDALLAAGVWAPYECRRGECGSCLVTVLEGDPEHRDVCLTPQARQTYMCPCVSRAKDGALTLDL